MVHTVGHLLGNPSAEADKLLDRSFVETAEFRALAHTSDFHVVVGRRGSGKSALYRHLAGTLRPQDRVLLIAETPTEDRALALQSFFTKVGADYRTTRAACRVLWRGYMCVAIARRLAEHYKVRSSNSIEPINELLRRFPALTTMRSPYDFFLTILEPLLSLPALEIAGRLARDLSIEVIEEATCEALEKSKTRAIVLLDRLDEGWEPTAVPTALLGGIVLASHDFVEHNRPIQAVSFVRDNMFRALAVFEQDFSRHVESSVLRLRWDVNSLLHLVTMRLRVVLGTSTESDIKVWNRFASRGINNRDGFESCLLNTLYRPRDVIILLNAAYLEAQRDSRTTIVDADVTRAAIQISIDRLADLLKEYDVVLPGLRLFTELLRGWRAIAKFSEVIELIGNAMLSEDYHDPAAGDFDALGGPTEVFRALYGVGILGVRDEAATPFTFCHDGARSDIAAVGPSAAVAIHPCYWRALDVVPPAEPVSVASEAFDEYEPVVGNQIRDLRTVQLGKTVEELPRLLIGQEHAAKFEDWVARALKIVFAGALSNIVLSKESDPRVITASSIADSGFWRHIREQYQASQITFEILNHAELGAEDLRRHLSDPDPETPRFVAIVYRSESGGADEKERQILREIFARSGKVVFLLLASDLKRFVAKYRGKHRRDYWERSLEKRLALHLKSFLRVDISSTSRPRNKLRRLRGVSSKSQPQD